MRNFYRSKAFLVAISIIFAIIIWIYVVYEVTPMYETWIKEVPVQCINVSSSFDDGSLTIMDSNKNLLKNGVSVDVKIRGKRNVVSSITKDDISCTVDMITVNKSGVYTLKPTIESDVSGLEFIKNSPYSIKIKAESIEQRDISVSVKTTGTVPDGYSVDNIENHNETIKVTGPTSVVAGIKRVEALLDYSKVDVKTNQAAAKIYFYDSDGKEVDGSLFKKTTEYAKLTFELHTDKEVTVILMPKYKDEVNKNSKGQTVRLEIEGENARKDGGIKIKVKLKGSSVSIEKYIDTERTIYTDDINVNSVLSDKVFEGVSAAPLSGNVEFVEVPKVNIKAIVDNNK